jgi:uncharacterized protein
MLSLLPDFADPLRLCALGKAYEGAVPLADLPRLAPLLTSTEGEAAFVLAFDTDTEHRPTVRVEVHANLALQCQRCLGSVLRNIDSASLLVVVSGPEEAARLPDEVDPLLVDGDAGLALRSLIEDELILAIPPAPVHRPDECAVSLDDLNAAHAGIPESEGAEDEHPFAALAGLKRDSDNQD